VCSSSTRVLASGREAKIYSITAKGRRRLAAQVEQWRELSVAIGLILGPA